MYLGHSPPRDPCAAGTNDFKRVLGLNKITEYSVNYYVIDGNHLNEGESKKIYIGIDVRNAESDETEDKDSKYYENNKYKVIFFCKKDK
jgi:type IV secretion system protein VirB6